MPSRSAQGTEWKAAPKASRRLQGMVIAPMPQVAGILATTAAPAGGVPATPTVAPAATVAPVATAAPAATTAAPLNPTLNIPGFAPPDTPGMSVAAVPSGAALTGDFPTSTSPTVAPVATEACKETVFSHLTPGSLLGWSYLQGSGFNTMS